MNTKKVTNEDRWLISMFLLALTSATASLFAADTVGNAKKPNILFLFSDDHCFEAVRAFGLTDIDTPNLDRLAARGMTFNRAYNMGAWGAAVCVASRAMLITGRSVWDAQKTEKSLKKESEQGALWPQLIQKAGYKTYMTGKWHIATDAAMCFDVVKNVRAGMPKTVPEAYNRPLADQADVWSPFDAARGGFWQGGTHWSEVLRDDTISFLADAKQQQKPFFIYAAFNAPHDPRQAPKTYIDQYPLSRMAMPPNFLPEYPYKDPMGCSHSLRDERLAPMPRTELSVKTHRQEYYALISHMDAQIGRILDALEANGQADNTWIFFTGDHGLAVGQHGLFGKQNMYDHSVRVPFLVAGPGVKKGEKTASPIYLQDVMATTLDIAGAQKPDHIFFNSILPLMNGQASRYESVYGAYLELQRAVTHGGWKLIAYPKAKVLRLYNLAQDPFEKLDLAAAPEHAALKQGLFERLVKLSADLGDELNLRTVFP